jgi:N-acetylglucosaminyldiphosphoundecaprenol N-acetyl-beta-D-mannosaminyltransferase
MEDHATELILGYAVSTLTIARSVRRIERWLADEAGPRTLYCANPHSLVLAEDDPDFQQALHGADLLTPDGSGIVLASKILGGRIRERVTGSDIYRGLSEALNAAGGRSCYFLGSTETTLATIRQKMAQDYPAFRFAGSYSPPFRPEFTEEENEGMIEAINAAAPDVLWVGMTAPKQEKWIHRNRDRLNVGFIGAIGAVFDFYAGNIKRSPLLFQKCGLEWLPRLLQEPRRLFRRNFVSSPLFLWRLMGQLLKK